MPPISRAPIEPVRDNLQQNARNTNHRYGHYNELQPTFLPSPLITHRANCVNPYPATAVPISTTHFAAPNLEPRFVVPPMIPLPHFIPPSPSPPQYTFGLPVHNFGLFQHSVGSPLQPSPQGFYMNDARYGCTPSSISSVETFYDHLAGAVLISPDYPVNVSPQSNPSHSLPSNSTRNSSATVRNSNLNLKKLRQGSLRTRMNQLEGSEGKVGDASNLLAEVNNKLHQEGL